MSVKWTGLHEFRSELMNLPATLQVEAALIISETAESVKREVVQAYPSGLSSANPGSLKRGVTLRTQKNLSGGGFSATVRSGARHAYIFENGTRLRRTDKGWNRGRMPEAPPTQQMIPIVVRARRRMVARLIEIVQKAGFKVTSS